MSGTGSEDPGAAAAHHHQAAASSSDSFLLNQPVVIDNGSHTIKAGFAGTSKPKVRMRA